jgi:transposase-like protein
VDDKVKIRCPACTRVFRERAGRVRDGVQLNCPDCCKLITFSKETNDPYLRRALKTAKEIRQAQQDKLAKAIYAGEASASKRETP